MSKEDQLDEAFKDLNGVWDDMDWLVENEATVPICVWVAAADALRDEEKELKKQISEFQDGGAD